MLLVCEESSREALAQGTLGWGDVIPVGSTFQDANSSTDRPFSFSSSRFQQVYRANNFVSPGQYGGVLVARMGFRLDATNGTLINNETATLEVRMSTTSRAPDSLSPVYADNIGLDNTLVFSGTIQWAANPSPGGGAQAFELPIFLQQEFLYRPALGNLLVDITVSTSTIRAQLDAWQQSPDPVSVVYGSSASGSGTLSTIGLVTRFDGTLVPEPAPILLALIGCLTMRFLKGRKR
jgi:hypothetical protein